VPDFGLRRLRRNPLLQLCLVVSFVCYGGMVALLVAGRLGDRAARYGNAFVLAAVVTTLSLLSWFFLWLWYPALDLTRRAMSRKAWVGISLEVFAVACVALVTLTMALIVLYLATT
jgi:MFS family permease